MAAASSAVCSGVTCWSVAPLSNNVGVFTCRATASTSCSRKNFIQALDARSESMRPGILARAESSFVPLSDVSPRARLAS
jgi:hypothetical protein